MTKVDDYQAGKNFKKGAELEIKKIIYWDKRKQKEWNKNNISYQVPVDEVIFV